jgi:outer membrane protein assembly factor BamD
MSWLAVGTVFTTACSTATIFSKKDVRQPDAAKKAVDGTDEQIFVEDSADKHYHPNVMMKRGEAFFEKQEYAEALTEYNRFLDLYHSHVLAPYAAFRIGEVHLKSAKTIDRDPEPMQKAITAFERVRKEFPGSRYDAQAQQKLEECDVWLAQMHLFVGQFYYRRGSYLAAAHRFEQIMKLYPDKPVAPDALYFLAKAYHEMGADDWAWEKLVLLAEKYPDSSVSDEGKSLMAKLKGAQPATLLAQKSDSIAFSDIGPTTGRSTSAEAPGGPSIASPPQLGSLGASAAHALGQTFTACRLGVWC